MTASRLKWEEVWLDVVKIIARRSKCTNRQVGAAVVSHDNRLLSIGYNGPPANFPTPLLSDCGSFCERSSSLDRGASYGNCVSVHAEANALLFIDRSVSLGATMYVTNPPCWECSKLIANSGITRVVCVESACDAHAPSARIIELFNQCSIQIYVIEE